MLNRQPKSLKLKFFVAFLPIGHFPLAIPEILRGNLIPLIVVLGHLNGRI